MRFSGYSRVFSTRNEAQYETIGAFWDALTARYGLETLRGLGFNWREDSIEYVIGFRKGAVDPADCPPGAVFKEVELPDTDWQTWRGRTDDLAAIYEKIYRDGPLRYEIETFADDGSCEIQIYRV